MHFPQLPEASRPDFSYWMGLLHLDMHLLPPGKTTVIAHSLGAWLWIAYATGRKAIHADRVLLVAPPSREWLQKSPQLRGVPSHLFTSRLPRMNKATQLLESQGDPLCSPTDLKALAEELSLPLTMLPGSAGHINETSGYGSWPAILEWTCNTEVSDFHGS